MLLGDMHSTGWLDGVQSTFDCAIFFLSLISSFVERLKSKLFTIKVLITSWLSIRIWWSWILQVNFCTSLIFKMQILDYIKYLMTSIHSTFDDDQNFIRGLRSAMVKCKVVNTKNINFQIITQSTENVCQNVCSFVFNFFLLWQTLYIKCTETTDRFTVEQLLKRQDNSLFGY